MKRCSTCKASKDAKEFRKNKAAKDGLQNVCKSCHTQYCVKWKKANPDKVSASMRRNYVKNIEDWKQYTRDYNKLYPAKAALWSKKRHKVMLQQTPKWLTESDWMEMNWAYKIAQQKTIETGIQYEVDHIIPLQGKIVSGFHCPQNLQIITRFQNASKGNKF